MSEMAAEENDQLVQKLYLETMTALHAGETISAERRLIHDVEHLLQEANSGASFEQYFRWASLDEIAHICDHLRAADLEDVARLTLEAIGVAFPNGLPATDNEKSDATDWTQEQEEALVELFLKLEDQNGRITSQLAVYAKRVGA